MPHNPAMPALKNTAFKAAIVDLDGTMVDTVGDFEVALRLALADLGWPPVDRDFIARTVGKGSEYLLLRTLDRGRRAARRCTTAAWARYQHHYLAINGQFSAVYPGVVEGLQALRRRGLRLACLTNKPNAFARPLLAIKGLDGLLRARLRRRRLRAQEARSAAAAADLPGAGQRAGAHADGRRLAQRRRGGARRRLPGGAGQLRLQPRRAGGQRRTPTR